MQYCQEQTTDTVFASKDCRNNDKAGVATPGDSEGFGIVAEHCGGGISLQKSLIRLLGQYPQPSLNDFTHPLSSATRGLRNLQYFTRRHP